MKDYTSTIEKLRSLQSGYIGTGMGRILKEGSDAVEELVAENKRLTEENKELCFKIDYCTRTATGTGTEDLGKMWEKFDEKLEKLGKMED